MIAMGERGKTTLTPMRTRQGIAAIYLRVSAMLRARLTFSYHDRAVD